MRSLTNSLYAALPFSPELAIISAISLSLYFFKTSELLLIKASTKSLALFIFNSIALLNVRLPAAAF